MTQRAKSIFKKGSRTFFISSLLFPSEVYRDVEALYAFVRVADDYVDTLPQQPQKLKEMHRQLHGALTSRPVSDPIIKGMANVMRRHMIPAKWVDAFFSAMLSDVGGNICQTHAECERYMYGSAAVIGLMMCRIMKAPKKAESHGAALGRAFQYINFLRDINQDLSLGRQYIAQSIVKRHGLQSLEYDHISKHPDKFARCIRSRIEWYRGVQATGMSGLVYLNPKYRVAVGTAASMYEWTAQRIYKDPLSVYTTRIKPSRPRIMVTGLSRYVREVWC